MDQMERREEQDRGFPLEKVAWTLLHGALKFKNHNNVKRALQSKYPAILKLAVSKKARWFYNGESKEIVNATYFREEVFPYVTLRTRRLIVRTLAYRLIDTEFAETMFKEIKSLYGIQEALPLLIACEANFSMDQIKNYRIVLSCKFLMNAYRRNSESKKLVIDYLRCSIPSESSYSDSFKIDISNYATFLPNLIKENSKTFLDLYETHAGILTDPNKTKKKEKVLNTKQIFVLLKNELEHMEKKPELFLDLLLHKFNKFHQFPEDRQRDIEKLLSSTMPEDIGLFNTDSIFKYIKYFPKRIKNDLLYELYQQKYHCEFLDNEENITPEIMLILPDFKRMDIASRKKQNLADMRKSSDYKKCWVCYLSIPDSIPLLEDEFTKIKYKEEAFNLISKMIYTCKINNNDHKLASILEKFGNYYENFYNKLFEQLLQLYDHFSLDVWENLEFIIQKCYSRYGLVTEDILVANLLYRLPDIEASTLIIDMLLQSTKNRCYFQFPKKCKEHEKMVLNISEALVKRKYESQDWKKYKYELVCYFIMAICDFNARSDQEHKMSFSPWVKDKIIYLIKKESQKNCIEKMKKILENKELKVYKDLLSKDITANVMSGNARKLVKEDVQHILRNAKKYYKAFTTHYRNKNVQRFLRALPKENAIWLALMCNSEGKMNELIWAENTIDFFLMALLWDTSELITVLNEIFTEKLIKTDCQYKDIRNFENVLATVIRLHKQSVPFSFLVDLRIPYRHYFIMILNVLPSLVNRSHPPDMIKFARKLINEDTVDDFIRIRGIELISQLIFTNELVKILTEQWTMRSNSILREKLIIQIQMLFNKNPNDSTWELYSTIIKALTVEDKLFSHLQEFNDIPYKYLEHYVALYLDTIDSLEEKGFKEKDKIDYTVNLLYHLNSDIINYLSESVIVNIVRRFLFDRNLEIAEKAATFTLKSYLFKAKDKLDSRLEVFEELFRKNIDKIEHLPRIAKKVASDEEEERHLIITVIRNFVNLVVNPFSDEENIVIDRIHQLLKAGIHTPKIDTESYLLLKYAEIRTECKTPREFGIKIRQFLTGSFKSFYRLISCSEIVYVLRRYLQINTFVNTFVSQEDVYLDITEGIAAFKYIYKDRILDENQRKYLRLVGEVLLGSITTIENRARYKYISITIQKDTLKCKPQDQELLI